MKSELPIPPEKWSCCSRAHGGQAREERSYRREKGGEKWGVAGRIQLSSDENNVAPSTYGRVVCNRPVFCFASLGLTLLPSYSSCPPVLGSKITAMIEIATNCFSDPW